jgi:isoleucyl-tRNA synthetase
MDVAAQRTEMLENNSAINWFPKHIKQGRFAKTVESAPDWNMSRDRFWATAMPVWKGIDKEGKAQVKVVGSYAELKELSGKELDDYHRPWVDEITFTIDGVEYKRIDKVLDSWFESGSMPFAQFHYPFENQDTFEQNFPGDFIAEYVGQVRAWFYYLHAMSTGLFKTNSFKNVIVTGTLAGSDGRKMSKSLGNYTDPNELMDLYSADALRFLLLSSPLLNGEDFSLIDKDVADVQRKLSMIWNMFDFFTTYAEVDNWSWDGKLSDPTAELTHPLDKWILSRVHQLTKEVDNRLTEYDIPNAMAPILPFIDDASNWYVRRSRKRFWKSENDADKNLAYKTLHYVLTRLSITIAPFTPFLSEELFRSLTGQESVHLLDWPEGGEVNTLLLDRMAYVRRVITEGLAQRADAKIKVRQPLNKAYISGMVDNLGEDLDELSTIILEELNVKEWQAATSTEQTTQIDTKITPELKAEGQARELVRTIQNARKTAGLAVDDRIKLVIGSNNSNLEKVVVNHRTSIMGETLATSLTKTGKLEYSETVEIDGNVVQIMLEKT